MGLYGFVGNNALVFVDALGHNKFCAKCCPNKCRIGEIQLDQMTIFITATGKPSIDAAGSINLLEQSVVLTKAAVITFLQGPAAATGDALANVFSISASSVAGRIASLINENAFERLGARVYTVISYSKCETKRWLFICNKNGFYSSTTSGPRLGKEFYFGKPLSKTNLGLKDLNDHLQAVLETQK